MHADLTLTGITAFSWALVFALGGSVLAFFLVPVISLVQRGRISWITAARCSVLVAMFGAIPIRAFESQVIYHASFREGWWPLLWGAVYALAFEEALRVGYQYWRRKSDIKLDEDGYEED